MTSRQKGVKSYRLVHVECNHRILHLEVQLKGLSASGLNPIKVSGASYEYPCTVWTALHEG